MSDIMFDEVKIEGKPYAKGDWRKYAVHTDTEIKGFFGDYRFLSNMWPVNVYGFPSVENAYMAAKIVKEERDYFKTCSPYEAKKNWRKFKLIDFTPPDWDERKFDVMSRLVFEKFLVDKVLRAKLLETGDKYIEETNWWGDSYWGCDIKKGGFNHLGEILMGVRAFWQTQTGIKL
jgi:ribA/ribD-fused uncharacterized protein